MRVFRQQEIYYLPDMKNMQVKLGLHESVINRVKTGQTVSIRLDAFADQKLNGKGIVCCGTGREQFFGHKELRCDCTDRQCSIRDCIETRYDDCRGRDTRRHLHDILAVPVGAVTEQLSEKLVYVQKGSTYERRRDPVGRVTQSFVEIVEGLSEGEVVAMDAYQRGTKEFGAAERKQGGMGEPKGAPRVQTFRRAQPNENTMDCQLERARLYRHSQRVMHKLRSFNDPRIGLWGVSSVVVMLAVAEGASRTAQLQMSRSGGKQCDRAKCQTERGPARRLRSFIMNYGLSMAT